MRVAYSLSLVARIGLLMLGVACDRHPPVTLDASTDAAFDARSDAPIDAAPEVRLDSSIDAAADVGLDSSIDAADACVVDCGVECTDDVECADDEPCNGDETCSDYACVRGAALSDASECHTLELGAGVCRAEVCIAAGCGNRVVEPGEACDDGNEDPGDGCTPDCTFTCTGDAECRDDSFCNGRETCDLATHTCMPGVTPRCDDSDVCTMDSCDFDLEMCMFLPVDADGDSHSPWLPAECGGDDCDDMSADVRPGAEEICDGIDNDCSGEIDEDAPTWFVDCDADGYAADMSGSRRSCSAPLVDLAGCAPGAWTDIAPVDAATTDCAPSDPAIRPTAIEVVGDEIDQDCDGSETCYFDEDDDGFRPAVDRTLLSADADCDDLQEANASQPTTDCCDTDYFARPGGTRYYATPRTGCGGFDYDCDMMETPERTERGSCVDGCTTTITGWAGGVPACGEIGSYLVSSSCQRLLGVCLRSYDMVPQGCR